jgi:hypothetical protein
MARGRQDNARAGRMTKLERLRKSWQDAENDIVGGDNSKAAEDYADYAYCAYYAELKKQMLMENSDD